MSDSLGLSVDIDEFTLVQVNHAFHALFDHLCMLPRDMLVDSDVPECDERPSAQDFISAEAAWHAQFPRLMFDAHGSIDPAAFNEIRALVEKQSAWIKSLPLRATTRPSTARGVADKYIAKLNGLFDRFVGVCDALIYS